MTRRPFPDPREPLPPHLDFVLNLSPSVMTLGLGNVRALMERLDHPERRFRSVLVAGTNGKGSTTAMLAAILSGHGVRTGRYTSPHVFYVAERIAVDGVFASLDELEAAAARIVPLYPGIPFSYFEALTAIAFLVFAARGVEVAVLEVGLGGRFDATNVVEPDVSVITSISLDHRRILGDTEAEILLEKLGVARAGRPLLVGPLAADLRAIVEERAARTGVPVQWPESGAVTIRDQTLRGLSVEVRTVRADYGRLEIPFGGRHQADNAFLAVAAAEHLVPALPRLRDALAAASIPGRFQCSTRAGRTFVIDVAHNEGSLIATAAHLAAFRPRHECAFVFGLLRRKELFDAPLHMLRSAGCLCLVQPEADPDSGEAAFAPHELLARFFAPHLPDSATDVMLWNRAGHDDPLARLLRWLEHGQDRITTVVVTGSHRVVEAFGRRMMQTEGGHDG